MTANPSLRMGCSAFLLSLLACSLSWAQIAVDASERPRQVPLRPSAFVALARHLADADELARWEFADLTLATLLDLYGEELEASRRERPPTAAQRAKLARWQRGTEELIDSLRASRARLSAGASATVRVDAQRQVLLFVAGQAVVVSGPRAESEAQIEERVIQRFCAYNDCGWLAALEGGEAISQGRRGGTWVLQQDRPPAYEIGDLARFEFSGLAQRERKAEAARNAAEELRRLADALQQAKAKGYRIDWEVLNRPPLSGSPDGRIVLDAGGSYVPLNLSLLPRLPPEDWERVVAWLRRGGPSGGGMLEIEGGERLTPAVAAE